MKQDNIYIFDKKTFKKELLGEIQTNFNMSLVIDGTKDSCSCIVYSYKDIQIEPYTIVWHEKTNSWWIVSNDKVDRYQNESGFLYIHNLDLLGAIELLNARDLTDCGFNTNTYTVRQVITRLLSLSNFEFANVTFNNIPLLSKKVEFTKVYENYTLLSAIRELLDGYNHSIKLTFVVSALGYITIANFNLVSKTGDNSLSSHDIDFFDDTRETKTINKNSFGTTVVSNAENITSSIPKTFPLIGGVKFSAHEHVITAKNAIVRLPSNVFKANWIALVPSIAPIKAHFKVGDEETYLTPSQLCINALDRASLEYGFQKIIDEIYTKFNADPDFEYRLLSTLREKKEWLFEQFRLCSTMRVFSGNGINAYTGTVVKGDDVPYLAQVQPYASSGAGFHELILCTKEDRECLDNKNNGIEWSRGKNEITGFNILDDTQGVAIRNLKYTDIQLDVGLGGWLSQNEGPEMSSCIFASAEQQAVSDVTPYYLFELGVSGKKFVLSFKNCQCIVNYYPMADLKLKADNTVDKRDVQLYNQNGKITDGIAFSKLMNSYSKEISSETITRYKTMYDIYQVPQLGSFVYKNNDIYIINNISLTFNENEINNLSTKLGYEIECEFTMSKYCSTKSLMVNPNTNIRDYGIPQNYNVKRKQLYRDFYEFNYYFNDDTENNYYYSPLYTLRFTNNINKYLDMTALIKLGYEELVESEIEWYYQLDTTYYDSTKSFYIVVDFNDNNIIGYCSQNVFSGFDVKRIFDGMTDTINTPISYTDEKGWVKDIELSLLTNEELTSVYMNYEIEHQGESSNWGTWKGEGGSLYNASIFIPQEIYDNGNNYSHLVITEDDYYKDPIEVPVFEYSCQIDDTYDFLIGDDILKHHKGNYIYFYSYVYGTNLNQDNVATDTRVSASGNILSISNSVTISISTTGTPPTLNGALHLLSSTTFDKGTFEFTDSGSANFVADKDYAIFRHVYNLDTMEEETQELLLIAKKVPSAKINNSYLYFAVNHYKLN